ncbi:oxidoreductase [Salipaludibacillus keqinensis]|uniref:Oxidoreductase n=1 Tax=Salipaludibacillus keqinensis TaxID=2045207 RepID=A0A323TIF9_9BACI|nr:NAD(P)-dependent oxidoreductase [Salipaludibacillus keqinensis]PYZ93347.1 oxidoreductase [Salipaludibacillus keqinensis]
MTSKKVLGFIGLGNMGYHMAKHLIRNQYEIKLYDINRSILDDFKEDNVGIASSPKDVADQADIVLVSLPTPQVVKKVALGEDGIISGNKVSTYIDLSTSGKDVSAEVGEAFLKKGIKVLDSPVSGGVSGAEKGTLALMVAGEKKLFEEHYEMLKLIGSKVMYAGDQIGQGQVIKVINNLLSSSALALTSEAMVLGVKAGLDPNTMIDILNVSSGRNSATEDKFKKSVINRKFDYGFSTNLAYKDMKLCMELAEKMEVPMFLGQHITHFWRYSITQGNGEEDYTRIINHFEKWADIEVGELDGE